LDVLDVELEVEVKALAFLTEMPEMTEIRSAVKVPEDRRSAHGSPALGDSGS